MMLMFFQETPMNIIPLVERTEVSELKGLEIGLSFTL